jgi:hypothetical protein
VSYIEDELDFTTSNRFTRVVFLRNTNNEMAVNVYMPFNPRISPGGGDILLEFTNLLVANGINLYVQDDFGVDTNFDLLVDQIAGYRLPTQIPIDYTVFEGNSFTAGLAPSSPQDVPSGTYTPPGNVTNQWQAYEAQLRPLSYVQEDIYGRNPTNGPGRMEFHASRDMNLSDSDIQSQNYMLIEATNNYSGNTNAQIAAPVLDLNLRTTNSVLIISNLVASQLARFEGTLDLYSARWTNTETFAGATITNHYHVLFADANFTPNTPERSQDVAIRTVDPGGASDQLIISDLITVTRSLLLDSSSITFTTNGTDADSRAGGINVEATGIVWPSSAPRLQYLTNNGTIEAVNAMFFGGVRNSPYYSSNFTEPYQVFINSGAVSNFSSTIQANLFMNSGTVSASGGVIDLTSITAISTNGAIYALSNSVSLTATSLVISNNPIVAGAALNLFAGGLLDDGSLNPSGADSADFVTNKNIWVTGNGFNLLSVPYGSASLLATTITNVAPPLRNVIIRSAARDLGCGPEGFDKNAAVGRVVLNGGDRSLFTFQAVNGNNAIYIDDLQLYGYTTNYTNQTFYGIRVNPGMKVYFANAEANGVIIADKLNGANNGAFCWVSNYNCGFFSSTNMVYPDGSTNRLNTALVEDCNIDSDNDGIVNCSDPSPVPAPVPTCTPAPFPPVGIPIPATSANTTGGTTGSTNVSSSVVGSPKLGFPGASENNGKATLLKGIFSGLFSDQSNGVASASSGYFTLSELVDGEFTAKLILGGHTYSAAGMFGSSGSATVKFFRPNLPTIKGSLQLDSSGDQVTGTLTAGPWVATVGADLHVFTKSGRNAGDYAGAYTIHIPGVAIGDGGPVGDSFGTVTIDQAGVVKFSGTLADGTKVNQTSSVSDDGYWPLYCSLYGGKGCLIGWLQVVVPGSIGGEVIWTKNAGADSKSYRSGFTNDVQAAGAVYHKPSGSANALKWSSGQVILLGGGLSGSTNSITIQKSKASAASSKLQLDIVSPSGLFKGHMLNPNGGTLQIQGVLLQDVGYGFGYFINSGQSGQVVLAPNP